MQEGQKIVDIRRKKRSRCEKRIIKQPRIYTEIRRTKPSSKEVLYAKPLFILFNYCTRRVYFILVNKQKWYYI